MNQVVSHKPTKKVSIQGFDKTIQNIRNKRYKRIFSKEKV
jgi:hypothetical protein